MLKGSKASCIKDGNHRRKSDTLETWKIGLSHQVRRLPVICIKRTNNRAQLAGALFDVASTAFPINLIECLDHCGQLNAIESLVIFMQSNFAKGVDR